MTDPFRRQKIQNWATEFADSDLVRRFPGELQEHAARLAEAFLLTACQARNVEPGALTEADIRTGLLKGTGSLALLPQARALVPEFCAVFLEMLQTMGRVAGGCALPVYVRGLAKSFNSEAGAKPNKEARQEPDSPKVKPFVRPGSRLYPNDPCPCGSGKKYKKCCERLLE